MKTILITGTTNGIGRVTALNLARQGHKIVMANRNRQKSKLLAKEITQETGNTNISLLDLDLSSLSSVRQCAQEFKATHNKLDILLNNAGMNAPEEVITEDGYESQFAINNLAQLLFTVELLPALEAAAPAHVIFITSMMHKFGKLDFDTFKGWKKYNANASYAQSKLAMQLNAMELAERLRERNIAVNTLHPGAVSTGILDGYSPLQQFILRLFFTTPEKGARTSMHVAALEGSDRPTGTYFSGSKPAKPGKQVANQALRKKIWNLSCEYCGLTPAP